ncbi:NOP5NT-domain-containing protein [Ramaria rubella]|nr:NOP5NT-domain-containing protein [Ramaria rubella]
MATHVLFESASGYAVFEVKQQEEIGAKSLAVQSSIETLGKFGKMVQLISFSPFKSAAHALENANDISEGDLLFLYGSWMPDCSQEFCMTISGRYWNSSLPAPKKKTVGNVKLAVSESSLASSIKAEIGIDCDASERSLELIRGIRLHASKLLTGLQSDDLRKAQLGLGHSYSRAKVKFNVNRTDNMIIQAIAMLDQLDKDVNLFAMRVREWYGYHFPELVKIVPDNYQYAQAGAVHRREG